MKCPRTRPAVLASALVASITMTLTLGLALARDLSPEPDPNGAVVQDQDPEKDKGAAKDPKAKRKGPVAPAGAPPKKGRRPEGADPLGKGDPAAKKADEAKAKALRPPTWPYHYKLKIAGGDGTPLAATYYPARTRFNAPVVLLIHDRGAGRSGKDWEQPLEELKGKGLAEFLQGEGYAVLAPDLRFHGGNQPHREPSAAEWHAMPADLQAMYLFLVDRHNRGELNLAKLGVVAEGEAANLVASWASLPGAGVSSDGRVGDFSALVLISPVADSAGLRFASALPPIAPRIPIHLLCGDRDHASIEVVKAAQPIVERQIKSKVSYFDTNLHGHRLMEFFPKVVVAVAKSLTDQVKGRVIEWEPRYLLSPVQYQSEGTVETKDVTKKDATKADVPAKKAGP